MWFIRFVTRERPDTLPAVPCKVKLTVRARNPHRSAILGIPLPQLANMATKKTVKKNAFYAQSGGVSAVINASAAGVIETAKKYPRQIGKL